MNNRNAVLVGAILSIAIGALLVLSSRLPNSAAAPPVGHAPAATLAPPGTPLPSVAAYPQPRYHAGIEPHLPDTNPSLPTYTAQDAIDYIKVNPIGPRGWQITDPDNLVETVDFLTAGEVRKQRNMDLSLPDDFLVCLVKLHGIFGQAPPHGGPALVSTNGYVVFDAHTGDLIVNVIAPP